MKKPIHRAPLRLQKMIIVLQRYDLKITYKKGRELYVADALSRAYRTNDYMDIGEDEYHIMAISPASSTRLNELKEVAADEVYQLPHKTIRSGWPHSIENVREEIRDFFPST